ncbi:MAG: PilN domain-containing protein [Thermoanaerobaculia bacterium]
MEFRNLNLSSRPFYNYNFFIILSIFLYGFSIFFAIYTGIKIYNGFKVSENAKVKMEEMGRELKKIMEENKSLDYKLNSIDKKSLVEKAEEINSMVLQRNFSWSKLLQELEEVLPEEVRLISLSTSKSKEGLIKVRMSALSSKRDGMLQTIQALRMSPCFKKIQPVQFQDEERSGSMGKSFELTFIYSEKDVPIKEGGE